MSVAVSGNTVVVGAFHEDSLARGVNGEQDDNRNSNSGAAYIFADPSALVFANGFEPNLSVAAPGKP